MKNLPETIALELMREGRSLMRMHTTAGRKWFVVPGGQITDRVAERILGRPDVQPHDRGLFQAASKRSASGIGGESNHEPKR